MTPGLVCLLRGVTCAQLEEADAALARRHPDSLANLIRAAKPTAEEAEAVKALRAQVGDLEAKATDAEEAATRRLHALRQEMDKMKLGVRQTVPC